MSRNTSLITDAAQLQAQSDLDTYTAAVTAHIVGDWQSHQQLAVWPQAYTCGAGGVSPNTLRLLITDVTTSRAVVVPAFPVGTYVTSGLPIIVQQPVSQSVKVGNTYQLIVFASSTSPLAYQWFVNDDPIVGATTNAYSVAGAVAGKWTYKVTVTNVNGTVTSAPATVTVT
jgi:hypothetical protein